jgi:hypothetical protein
MATTTAGGVLHSFQGQQGNSAAPSPLPTNDRLHHRLHPTSSSRSRFPSFTTFLPHTTTTDGIPHPFHGRWGNSAAPSLLPTNDRLHHRLHPTSSSHPRFPSFAMFPPHRAPQMVTTTTGRVSFPFRGQWGLSDVLPLPWCIPRVSQPSTPLGVFKRSRATNLCRWVLVPRSRVRCDGSYVSLVLSQ